MPQGKACHAGAFLAAVCTTVATLTSAAVAQNTDPSYLSLQAPLQPAQAPGTEGLMQSQMRSRGLGGDMLDQFGLRLSGYAEAGVTFNFTNPVGGSNGRGRLFDDKTDDPKLHQLSLTLERQVVASPSRFDTGFKLQVIYGADARYTQANGTNFYGSSFAGQRNITLLQFQDGSISPFVDEISFPGQQYPENQIDVLQAFATFNVPVGDGLLVNAGKFVTPWGIEKIDPTQNALYSHSYIFAFLSPRTLTGVTASYVVDDQWTATAGLVVGWDQALEDNNDFPSLLGQVAYKYSEEWTFVITGMVGPEQEGNRSDMRWLIDITADWKVSDDTHIGIEAALAFEPNVGSTRARPFDDPSFNRFLEVTGDDAAWFGIAGYYSYRWDSDGKFVSTVRGEYFNDTDGGVLIATEVFALTAGLTIRPFVDHEIGRNLAIRPEIRYDYANDEIFDGTSRKTQWTAGADLVFSF